MSSSPKAPEPDPNIGIAAVKSAELGRDYLDFMRDQSEISNAWAERDRARYTDTFEPLQDEYIARAGQGPDYSAVEGDVRRAQGDVRIAMAQADDQRERVMAARGVKPGSGASMGATRRGELTEALAVAGAGNTTRLVSRARAEGEDEMRRTNAINLGSGLAVNPATSLGMGSNAMGQGFQGAMGGYRQQGNLLNTQYQQEMQAYNAQVAQQNSLWGGIGQIAGAMIFSSEDYKTGKTKTRGALKALQDMPVKDYRYKEGIADGGAAPHTGPMAEDFQAATGKGDGKTIPVQDMIGVTMGAVQELAEKVDKLAARGRPAANEAGDSYTKTNPLRARRASATAA